MLASCNSVWKLSVLLILGDSILSHYIVSLRISIYALCGNTAEISAPYDVNYKAEKMRTTLIESGPPEDRYNRTKSILNSFFMSDFVYNISVSH